MSWDEIKKAVNSDIQLPLNEKMEYIAGLMERGRKYIKKYLPGTDGTIADVLNIQGSGYLLEAKSDSSTYDGGRNSQISIYIDENTDESTSILLRSNTVDNISNGTLKIDINSVFSDIEKGAVNDLGNVAAITNTPIRFEKTLRVSARIESYAGAPYVYYILD